MAALLSLPGASETDFFERHGKGDAAERAETGFKAMMMGGGDVVSGWHDKLRTAIAWETPTRMLPEAHRRMTGP